VLETFRNNVWHGKKTQCKAINKYKINFTNDLTGIKRLFLNTIKADRNTAAKACDTNYGISSYGD
jgi:hypothetical protein